MDYEAGLKLLTECHRHIEALEEIAAQGPPGRWSTSVAEARERANKLMAALIEPPPYITATDLGMGDKTAYSPISTPFKLMENP